MPEVQTLPALFFNTCGLPAKGMGLDFGMFVLKFLTRWVLYIFKVYASRKLF